MNHDEMDVHDFSQRQGPTPGPWEAQQQQQDRIAVLEGMMQRMSQALDRLAFPEAPTPSVTPQPPPPAPIAPIPVPIAPIPLPPMRSAKVSPPEMYSGDRHKLYLYLSKCRHNFLSRPELFQTEHQKVLFASGYLDGAAYNWFQPLLDQYSRAMDNPAEESPAEFQSFQQYAKSLESTFGDPDIVRSKERELRNLTQTSSVASYLADFSRIKGFVKWNDEALASQFYKGLKPAVKDGLVYENPAPTTLTQLSSAALRIDSRQFEHLLERRLESSAPSQFPRNPRPYRASSPPPRPSAPATPAAPRPTPAPTPAPDGSTPMELDLLQSHRSHLRGPLDDTEYRRRRDHNLCLYCASPDHRVATCTLNRSPRFLPSQRVQVAQTPSYADIASKAPAQG